MGSSSSREEPTSTTSQQHEDENELNENAEESNAGQNCEKPPKIERKSSISLKYRQEGNTLFQKARVDGLAPVIKKSRLEEALSCYEKALKTAKSDLDALSSAAKNYAKTCQNLIPLFEEDELKVREFHIKVISYYSQALYHGEQKTAEWRDDIVTSYGKFFEEAMDRYRGLPATDKIGTFEAFAHVMMGDLYKGDLYMEIASLLLHEALNAVGKRDFKSSLNLLKQMNRPIEEMKRHSEQLAEKANEMEIDMIYNLASTESLQAINSGDMLLEKNLKENEQMNMDLVYVVIDFYRQAMVLSREIEVEIEAIALSRLGKLYDKVLKMKFRAKDCFKKCLELAMSLTPRIMTAEPWHLDATMTLERYQKESVVAQDAERDRLRKQYQDELSKEFEDLASAQTRFSDDYDDLLMHIYQSYPVKRKTSRKPPTKEELKILKPNELKKVYQKALLDYQPDKQDVDEHGLKWKVLCDEIAKVLTNSLEFLDC